MKPKKANNSKACLGGQGKPTKQKPSRLAQGPPQATPPPCRQADIMQSKRTAPQADLEGPGAKVYPLTESRKPALVRLNRQQKGGHSSYRKTDLDQPAESSKQPIENPLQASSIKKRQNQRQHRLLIGWPFLRRRQKETKPYRTSETPKHSSWGGSPLIREAWSKAVQATQNCTEPTDKPRSAKTSRSNGSNRVDPLRRMGGLR